MNIVIPKLTQPVALTDYAPELLNGSQQSILVHVWVNPPRVVLEHYFDNLERAKEEPGQWNDFFAAWYAQLWSQHPDPETHWTAEEVKTLASSDTDPALYVWLVKQSHDLIAAHRRGEKKK